MEPSTTNSNENLHKIHTPTNDDHQHQPLIISCEIVTPHQEQEMINGSSQSREYSTSTEAFLIRKGGGDRVENEPLSGAEKVVIPERWGQEGLLKDWMDYSSFDALLAPEEAGLAREALVAQAAPRGCGGVSNIYHS